MGSFLDLGVPAKWEKGEIVGAREKWEKWDTQS